jgi:hypothetical protein
LCGHRHLPQPLSAGPPLRQPSGAARRLGYACLGGGHPAVGQSRTRPRRDRSPLGGAARQPPGGRQARRRDQGANPASGQHRAVDRGLLEGRSRDEEEEILEKTSRILAGITGKGPIGYRAPLFEITHETVGLLRKHGFTYASNLQDSLWPYAYPGAPPLVELPVQWMLDDGPYFAYGLRPPLYRQIFPPSAVLSIWKEEFRAMYELGGALTLTLHPQYSGRPSRVKMLQDLVRSMRTLPGVWFTHGAEVARYAASEAAGIGTDGRPRPSPVGSRNGRPRRSPARRR